jgi:hypothetical protein
LPWEAIVLRRDEGGASLVEFALVLPLILMLILGMVTAGIAYNEKMALAHAARESSRFGATLPVGNMGNLDAWLDAVKARAVADATGSLDPGTPGLWICVAYVYPNGSGADDRTRRVVDDGTPPDTYEYDDCYADGRPGDERRIQVQVRRDTELDALFFSTTVSLGSEAASRYESGPGS